MAKAIVDTCVLSQQWFIQEVLPALIKERKVLFVFTSHRRMMQEVNKNKENYLRLYKEVGAAKRRVDISEAVVDAAIVKLEANATWKGNASDCDDPHIFALVGASSAKYVFSTDIRMGNCRDCVRNSIKSRYCRFKLISSQALYVRHRSAILA